MGGPVDLSTIPTVVGAGVAPSASIVTAASVLIGAAFLWFVVHALVLWRRDAVAGNLDPAADNATVSGTDSAAGASLRDPIVTPPRPSFWERVRDFVAAGGLRTIPIGVLVAVFYAVSTVLFWAELYLAGETLHHYPEAPTATEAPTSPAPTTRHLLGAGPPGETPDVGRLTQDFAKMLMDITDEAIFLVQLGLFGFVTLMVLISQFALKYDKNKDTGIAKTEAYRMAVTIFCPSVFIFFLDLGRALVYRCHPIDGHNICADPSHEWRLLAQPGVWLTQSLAAYQLWLRLASYNRSIGLGVLATVSLIFYGLTVCIFNARVISTSPYGIERGFFYIAMLKAILTEIWVFQFIRVGVENVVHCFQHAIHDAAALDLAPDGGVDVPDDAENGDDVPAAMLHPDDLESQLAVLVTTYARARGLSSASRATAADAAAANNEDEAGRSGDDNDPMHQQDESLHNLISSVVTKLQSTVGAAKSSPNSRHSSMVARRPPVAAEGGATTQYLAPLAPGQASETFHATSFDPAELARHRGLSNVSNAPTTAMTRSVALDPTSLAHSPVAPPASAVTRRRSGTPGCDGEHARVNRAKRSGAVEYVALLAIVFIVEIVSLVMLHATSPLPAVVDYEATLLRSYEGVRIFFYLGIITYVVIRMRFTNEFKSIRFERYSAAIVMNSFTWVLVMALSVIESEGDLRHWPVVCVNLLRFFVIVSLMLLRPRYGRVGRTVWLVLSLVVFLWIALSVAYQLVSESYVPTHDIAAVLRAVFTESLMFEVLSLSLDRFYNAREEEAFYGVDARLAEQRQKIREPSEYRRFVAGSAPVALGIIAMACRLQTFGGAATSTTDDSADFMLPRMDDPAVVAACLVQILLPTAILLFAIFVAKAMRVLGDAGSLIPAAIFLILSLICSCVAISFAKPASPRTVAAAALQPAADAALIVTSLAAWSLMPARAPEGEPDVATRRWRHAGVLAQFGVLAMHCTLGVNGIERLTSLGGLELFHMLRWCMMAFALYEVFLYATFTVLPPDSPPPVSVRRGTLRLLPFYLIFLLLVIAPIVGSVARLYGTSQERLDSVASPFAFTVTVIELALYVAALVVYGVQCWCDPLRRHGGLTLAIELFGDRYFVHVWCCIAVFTMYIALGFFVAATDEGARTGDQMVLVGTDMARGVLQLLFFLQFVPHRMQQMRKRALTSAGMYLVCSTRVITYGLQIVDNGGVRHPAYITTLALADTLLTLQVRAIGCARYPEVAARALQIANAANDRAVTDGMSAPLLAVNGEPPGVELSPVSPLSNEQQAEDPPQPGTARSQPRSGASPIDGSFGDPKPASPNRSTAPPAEQIHSPPNASVVNMSVVSANEENEARPAARAVLSPTSGHAASPPPPAAGTEPKPSMLSVEAPRRYAAAGNNLVDVMNTSDGDGSVGGAGRQHSHPGSLAGDQTQSTVGHYGLEAVVSAGSHGSGSRQSPGPHQRAACGSLPPGVTSGVVLSAAGSSSDEDERDAAVLSSNSPASTRQSPTAGTNNGSIVVNAKEI